MAKYVKIEAIKKSIIECCGDFTEKDAEYIVERVSDADVVEVVRCKDCKHFRKYNGYERGECRLFTELISSMQLNDYCSYGERKCDNE